MAPALPPFNPVERTSEFKSALKSFTKRLAEDKNILAAVLVGSIEEEYSWRKDSIGFWII